jgi:hypothetical protein
MRMVLSLLVVAALSTTLPKAAAADEPEASAAPAGTGAAVAPSNAHTLAQVHGGLTADGARVAGRSRDVEMSATKLTAAKVVRPVASPRVLRRMAPERVSTTIDPAVRACASESPTVAPTSVGIRVAVAPEGAVEAAELAGTTRIAPALLACVVRAVSAARFGAPGAAGASVVLTVTVPGRPVRAPAVAEPKAEEADVSASR